MLVIINESFDVEGLVKRFRKIGERRGEDTSGFPECLHSSAQGL